MTYLAFALGLIAYNCGVALCLTTRRHRVPVGIAALLGLSGTVLCMIVVFGVWYP